MKNIYYFLFRWDKSATLLEKRMDVTLVLLSFLLPVTALLTYLIQGISFSLPVFETFWILLFLILTTLGLRLRLVSLKQEFQKKQASKSYHTNSTTKLELDDFEVLLQWSACLIIALVFLVLSFAFPIVR